MTDLLTNDNIGDNTIDGAKITDGTLHAQKIVPFSITSAQLLAGTIGTTQLADAAVDGFKIASGAVGTAQIASGAVGTAQIASGAVGTAQIAPGAVGTAQIASGAVGTAQIAEAAVTTAKLAPSSVEAAQLKDGAVESSKISAGAVGTAAMADLAVTAAKLQAGAVTPGALSFRTRTLIKARDFQPWYVATLTVRGFLFEVMRIEELGLVTFDFIVPADYTGGDLRLQLLAQTANSTFGDAIFQVFATVPEPGTTDLDLDDSILIGDIVLSLPPGKLGSGELTFSLPSLGPGDLVHFYAFRIDDPSPDLVDLLAGVIEEV